ncbi:HAD family hydrolase [Holdemanella biformis]|uniref:HAD family hydrolase n=1 Tax=Holdemanella biformis TaxID=1735 RepID=UPI0022E68ABB|nr:HAD family hydrolase [Holdemanella biformis]
MYKTILFDIDGTLIDSEKYLMDALNKALKDIFNLSLTIKDFEFLLGKTETEIAKLVTSNKSLQKKLTKEWTKNVSLQKEPPILFNNVLETLYILKKRNIKIGIVTSKTKIHMKNDFDKLNINHLFDVIVNADMVTNTKPNAEPLLAAIKKLHSTPNDTLFIGDTHSDLECARNANIKFGLALWGTKLHLDDPKILYLNSFEDVINYI